MTTVSTLNGRYGSKRFKNPFIANNVIYVYPILIRLLRTVWIAGDVVVKPRDTCKYLGICDHRVYTGMGHLLNALAKLGIAERLNNSKPRRYKIYIKYFTRYLPICRIDRGEDYCIDKGCGGLGICPYWRIKQFLNGDRQ